MKAWEVRARIQARDDQIARLKVKRLKANSTKNVPNADVITVEIEKLRLLNLADSDLLAHLGEQPQTAHPGQATEWLSHMKSVKNVSHATSTG